MGDNEQHEELLEHQAISDIQNLLMQMSLSDGNLLPNLQQPDPQLPQSSGQPPSDHMQPVNQIKSDSKISKNKLALQQLLIVLKSPRSPQQMQQILHIVKSNPPIMAALLKLRQERLREMSEQQQNIAESENRMEM